MVHSRPMAAYVEDKERIAKLAKRYEPKIAQLLEMIGDACQDHGFMVEGPYGEQHDGEFAWGISVYPPSAAPPEGALLNEEAESIMDYVEVTVYIAISEHRDSTKGGMSFLIDTVHYDGTIIGGFAPFNQTPQVWVPRDDRDEVEDRWHTFVEGVDPSVIVTSIQNFYARKKR